MPPILADTERCLDDAFREDRVIDLQIVLLDLTTRLMGNMAYEVREFAQPPFQYLFRDSQDLCTRVNILNDND